MSHDDNVLQLQQRIKRLQEELAQVREKEKYYRDIAALTGRKRLRETRELSLLISQHKATQQELARHREELEKLVAERTEKLALANAQLSQNIEEQRKTHEQLQFRLKLDQVILDISSEFINLPIEKTDEGITRALGKIAQLA